MQVKTGVVISTKMKNTVVVKTSAKEKHPFYQKLINRNRKYKAHDDLGVIIGQKVKIIETKPISKDVHFKVLEKVE